MSDVKDEGREPTECEKLGLDAEAQVQGCRRVNLTHFDYVNGPPYRGYDSWVGSGRDDDHQPSGTWADWAVLADGILRHPNTAAVRPDLAIGTPAPDLLDAARDALEELRLIREKDGAGPYDPTLTARLRAALAKAEGRDG